VIRRGEREVSVSTPPGRSSQAATWRTGLVTVAAVVLLTVSLVSGWYSVDYTRASGEVATTWNETFYPGHPVGTERSCGGPYRPGGCPYGSGFPGPRTAELYGVVLLLLVGALAAAIAATVLQVRNPERSRRRTRGGVAIGAVGSVLALATALALFYLEPWAFGQDTGEGPPWASPSSSFIGSCSSYANCTSSVGGAYGTWGPAIGWYLAVIAGVLLAGSALLAAYRARSRGAR
jgi:hypothetical protein